MNHRKTNVFKSVNINSCNPDKIWSYTLITIVDKELTAHLECLGKLFLPLGEEYSFFKIESIDYFLSGNVGYKEIRLFVNNHEKAEEIKNLFEAKLLAYYYKK